MKVSQSRSPWLTVFQWIIVAIFVVTLLLGWLLPEHSELWVRNLFWSLFWPTTTVVLLLLAGPIFCGFCPLGTLGRFISARGSRRRLPTWLQWAGWSLLMLLGSYWLVNTVSLGYGRLPLYATMIFFTGFLLLMLGLSVRYKDAPFCRSLCPFAVLAKAFGKLGWLGLKRSPTSCKHCDEPTCSQACPQRKSVHRQPSNQLTSRCNLCLECYSGCKNIQFGWRRPTSSWLFNASQVDGWAYLLLTAMVVILTQLKHRWDRSALHEQLPWNRLTDWLQPWVSASWIDLKGSILALFAIALTLGVLWCCVAAASAITAKPLKKMMPSMAAVNLPLILCLLFSHGVLVFLSRGVVGLTEGVNQLLGTEFVMSGISRGSVVASILGLLVWVGVGWSLILAWRWASHYSSKQVTRVPLWLLASGVTWLYLLLRIGGTMLSAQAPPCH
ncbi:4Fe-4S binding protein [Shewanella sp. Isolate13]|uniref:4Fe-4S binding protein n=1 Tax=Shewanella sp. Isolate13 TaxID=2908531 RepID=UPI001EFEDAB2|nr:4Fe-4S binding protein [Shewanella sp. Isolate13]MCG9728397.1 4Fe-4S binding protein [Shewanella sp. Isolate13]